MTTTTYEPEPTWANPIWYGRWRIYRYDIAPYPDLKFAFVHDDYDGAPDAWDNRYGVAKSVEDAKAQIDDMEDED